MPAPLRFPSRLVAFGRCQGIRRQLKAFGLPTEPWAYLIGAEGVIKDRIEGAFGVDELEEAMRTIVPGADQPKSLQPSIQSAQRGAESSAGGLGALPALEARGRSQSTLQGEI
jgi:hypothetical protein